IWLLRDSIRRIFGNLTTASQSASGVVLSALFLLTAFSTALGLIPHKMRFGSLALSSDGLLLLRLWTKSKKRFAEYFVSPDWRDALGLVRLEGAKAGCVVDPGKVRDDPPVSHVQ